MPFNWLSSIDFILSELSLTKLAFYSGGNWFKVYGFNKDGLGVKLLGDELVGGVPAAHAKLFTSSSLIIGSSEACLAVGSCLTFVSFLVSSYLDGGVEAPSYSDLT